MMNILYVLGNTLYINMTNKCPCSCTFCIRKEGDGVRGSGSLWLDRDPAVEEVKAALAEKDLDSYDEIVFCGYGEPLVRINEVAEVGRYIKSVSKAKVRINTTGLSDLIHNKEHSVQILKGAIDSISISLNAPTAKEYNEVTRPKWGEKSFEVMLKFAKEAKTVVNEVMFSVVDVIGEDKIKRSQEIADELGVKLRVREME